MAKNDNDTPSFMQGDLGKGTEHVRPEMTVWLGEQGDIDPEAVLAAEGHDALTPFGQVCLAVIDSNPDELNRSKHERLQQAVSALLGKPKAEGRPPADRDDEILMAIARRYYYLWFHGQHKISLAPIVRECITSLSLRPPRTAESWETEIRRLRKKFLREKDLLLSRVTLRDHPDRMHDVLLARSALRWIARLGVPINPESMPPLTD